MIFPCYKFKLSMLILIFCLYLSQSSQDFTNPAFEPEDGYVDDHQFCDIVDQVLRQPLNGGRYVHPYGQGNLYKAILVGEKTKVPQSAGKLVFWAVFMQMMVGLACSIIILAGDHNKELCLKQTKLLYTEVGWCQMLSQSRLIDIGRPQHYMYHLATAW